jgi:hypothetical protein
LTFICDLKLGVWSGTEAHVRRLSYWRGGLHEFNVSLGNTARPHLENNKKLKLGKHLLQPRALFFLKRNESFSKKA